MANANEPAAEPVVHGADPSSKARLRSALDIARQYAEEMTHTGNQMSEEDIKIRQDKEKRQIQERKAREAAESLQWVENRKIGRAFSGIAIDPIAVFGRLLAWNLAQADIPAELREAAARVKDREAVQAMLDDFLAKRSLPDGDQRSLAGMPGASRTAVTIETSPPPIPTLRLASISARLEALTPWEGRELSPPAQALVSEIEAKLAGLRKVFEDPTGRLTA